MNTSVLESEIERDVLDALDRICTSEFFSEAEQIRKFLRYVVEEALAGRADRIKSYSVAVEALGKPADFDPTQDPIVRITANRLRSALAKYYNESADHHRVIIRLPKGHYIPEFDYQAPPSETAILQPLPLAAPVAAAIAPGAGAWRLVVAMLAAVGMFFLGLLAWERLTPGGSEPGLGRVWIIVQDLETGGTTDDDYARILADQLIAQMTRYDGVSIIDAGRSPNQHISRDQVSGNGWTEDHVFSLATYVRFDERGAAIRWYLTDMHSNQVMWASDRRVSFESGDGANAIVQSMAAELLGLEGAIPVILDRSLGADLADDGSCLARAQRQAFADDIMLIEDVADCLERVVRTHPQNGRAWALLSLAYQRQGRLAASQGQDAFEFRRLQQMAAQKATAISPETFFPHLAQLAAAYDAGQVMALENLADRMLLRYSGDPRLKVLIGKAFVSLGNPERGLPLIEAGLGQIPSLGALGYIMLALERYVAGDLESALEYLDAQTLPQDYRFWLMKTVVHSGAGDWEQAQAAWDALLTLRPGYHDNVCDDLRHARLDGTYFNRIVEDLGKVVSGLPEVSCRLRTQPDVSASTPGQGRAATLGGQ